MWEEQAGDHEVGGQGEAKAALAGEERDFFSYTSSSGLPDSQKEGGSHRKTSFCRYRQVGMMCVHLPLGGGLSFSVFLRPLHAGLASVLSSSRCAPVRKRPLITSPEWPHLGEECSRGSIHWSSLVPFCTVVFPSNKGTSISSGSKLQYRFNLCKRDWRAESRVGQKGGL